MVGHRLCDFVTRQRRQGSRLSKVGPRKLSRPESVAIINSKFPRFFRSNLGVGLDGCRQCFLDDVSILGSITNVGSFDGIG